MSAYVVNADIAETKWMFTFLCARLCKIAFKVLFALTVHSLFALPSYSQIAGEYQDFASYSEPRILDIVNFVGNEFFTDEQLSDAVSSRQSEHGITRRFIAGLATQLNHNTSTPKPILLKITELKKSLEQAEFRYFNSVTAVSDSILLVELYNQYGFHQAGVSYNYTFDSTNKKNVLTFAIFEGKRSSIGSIKLLGLENVPLEVAVLLENAKKIRVGDGFDEGKIKKEADVISEILTNNGYYSVRYDTASLTVTKNPYTLLDSITVVFQIQKRLRIASIEFVHEKRGQPGVVDALLAAVIETRVGDWFDRSSLQRSVNALLNLGLFERPTFDSIGAKAASSDTTIALRLYLPYRQAQELGLSPFANRTVSDNFFNLGIEASYLHRNLGGAAQSINIFARYFLQDFQIQLPSRLFSWLNSEAQIGLNFTQPVIFSVDKTNIAASGQLTYSSRAIQITASDSIFSYTSLPMALTTTSMRLIFPIQLPRHTFLHSAYLDVFSEAGKISDFNIAFDSASTQTFATGNLRLFSKTVQQFAPLAILNNLSGERLPISIVAVGWGLVGDSRDNIFSPQSGYFFTLAGEHAFSPIFGKDIPSKFHRLQLNYNTYTTVGKKRVLATKLRIGHIFRSIDDYIPFERTFFAGGSNSIRSYPSRALYDPVTGSVEENEDSRTVQQYLFGSESLLEGSIEYRWTFLRPAWASDFIGSQIERTGIGFFLDWGNCYNRIIRNSENALNLNTLLEGLAVGLGIGFRYDTPVGPFRIDAALPFYDPLSPGRTFISSRSLLGDLQFHIALGHAF